jgi:hypothetical protein
MPDKNTKMDEAASPSYFILDLYRIKANSGQDGGREAVSGIYRLGIGLFEPILPVQQFTRKQRTSLVKWPHQQASTVKRWRA